MDSVRNTWWSKGLNVADELRYKQNGRFSRAWGTDSIFMTKEKGMIINADFKTEEPQILGMRKRNFYINLAVLSVLLATFLAVGIYLGVNNYNNSFTSSATFAGVAASAISSTAQTIVQVFYQNTTTNAIQYQISSDALSYTDPQVLQLETPPKTNISMAATSFATPEAIFHQLFYVIDSGISVANITCPATDPSNCTTISESSISTGLTNAVATNSTIAAVSLQDGRWDVIYQNKEFLLTRITLVNGSWDAEGTAIGNKAVPGSGIATISFGTDAMEVIYMDEAGGGIFAVQSVNGVWSTPSAVTTETPAALSTTSSLAISYASASDKLQAFFTGSDSQIYEFIGTNVSSTDFSTAKSSSTSGLSETGWTSTPDNNEAWVLNQGPGAPMASTVMNGQVLFFQLQEGSMVQSRLNSTNSAWDVLII